MFYQGMDLIFFDFESTGVNVRGNKDDDIPIEVALVICDDKLIIKNIYNSLIKWNWMESYDKWPEIYNDAYKIHKIKLNTIKENGKTIDKVCSNINQLLKNYTNNQYKPTLISDNAYFDTFMMYKLFAEHNVFPFHYTTWDTNTLVKAAGVRKAKEHPHNALDDAMNMYHRTLRSLEKINYFD